MPKPPEPPAEPESTHRLPPPDPSHYRPPLDPADTPGMYDPVTLPPAYPQPRQPPPGRDNTGLLVAVAVGGLCLLAVVGLVVYLVARPADDTDDPTAAPTSATDSSPPAAAGTRTVPPVNPRADIGGDGTFVLGEDIEAGEYRTAVPETSAMCYWERLRGLSDRFDDIIANGVADPGEKLTVTLAKDDKAFKTQGCGAWNEV